MKRERLGVIDFISLQARDLALQHNEAVASYAVALLRMLRADGADAERWRAVDEGALMTALYAHAGNHASNRPGSTIAASRRRPESRRQDLQEAFQTLPNRLLSHRHRRGSDAGRRASSAQR